MSVRTNPLPSKCAPTRSLEDVLAAGLNQAATGTKPGDTLTANDARQLRADKQDAVAYAKRKARIDEQRKLDGLKSPLKPIDDVGLESINEEIACLFEAADFAERYVLPSTGSAEEMLLGVMIGFNRTMQLMGIAEAYEMEQFYGAAQTYLAFAASEGYQQITDAIDQSERLYEQEEQSGPDDVEMLASPSIGGFFNDADRGQGVRQEFKNREDTWRENWEVFTGYFEGVREWTNLAREGKMLDAYKFLKSVGKDALRELIFALIRSYVPVDSWFGSLFRDDAEIKLRDDLDWYYGVAKAMRKVAHPLEDDSTAARKEIAEAAINQQKYWGGSGGDSTGQNARHWARELVASLSFGLLYKREGGAPKADALPAKGIGQVRNEWSKGKMKVTIATMFPTQRLAYYAVSILARIWSKCLLYRVDAIERWGTLNKCSVIRRPPQRGAQMLIDRFADGQDCELWSHQILARIEELYPIPENRDAELQQAVRIAPPHEKLARRAELKEARAARKAAKAAKAARLRLYKVQFDRWKIQSAFLTRQIAKRPKAMATGWAGTSLTAFNAILNMAGEVSGASVALEFLPAVVFTVQFFLWRNVTMEVVYHMGAAMRTIEFMHNADKQDGGAAAAAQQVAPAPPPAPPPPVPPVPAAGGQRNEEDFEPVEEDEEAEFFGGPLAPVPMQPPPPQPVAPAPANQAQLPMPDDPAPAVPAPLPPQLPVPAVPAVPAVPQPPGNVEDQDDEQDEDEQNSQASEEETDLEALGVF